MSIVKVPLGDRGYDILIGRGLLARLGDECAKLGLGRRCAIISDRNVTPRFGKAAQRSLAQAGYDSFLITVAAGETAKSLKSVQFCHDQLAKHRLERKSFIVALGGGVVGDLTGFVAATYLRGISFIQVPTTLLAQVDASIGGKTGVDIPEGKNLVGAFYQPRLVWIDPLTLKSLPLEHWRNGMAEVIKYAVIADPQLFAQLEKHIDPLLKGELPSLWTTIITRCAQIKVDVVGRDPLEKQGVRALLNFGHS